jgi:hypothetical protein
MMLQRLQVWQDLAGACLSMGRPPRGQWTIKVRGRCPFVNRMVEEMGQGANPAEAIADLCDKLAPSLSRIPPQLLTT